MVDWSKARLGNYERGQRAIWVPCDEGEDPRKELPKAKPKAKPRPVAERRVPRYGRGGGDD